MKEKGSTRAEIARTAFELFRANGYAAVTVNDICEACSLSKNTFYYYYRSKEELLLEIYAGTNDFSLARMSAVFSEKSKVRQLWLLDEPFADFAIHAGSALMRHWWMSVLTKGLHRPEEDMGPLRSEMLQMSVSVTEQAQAGGEISNHVDAHLLVRAKTRLLLGTIVEWSLRDGAFDLKRELCTLIDTLYDVTPAYSLLAAFDREPSAGAAPQ